MCTYTAYIENEVFSYNSMWVKTNRCYTRKEKWKVVQDEEETEKITNKWMRILQRQLERDKGAKMGFETDYEGEENSWKQVDSYTKWERDLDIDGFRRKENSKNKWRNQLGRVLM